MILKTVKVEELNIITYKENKKTGSPINKVTRVDLKTILFDLYTLYPVGRLHDCESDEDLEGKIILGRTNLGSL